MYTFAAPFSVNYAIAPVAVKSEGLGWTDVGRKMGCW